MEEMKTLAKKAIALTSNKAEETKQMETINFNEFYRRNANHVFCYLYSIVCNVSDAEDLTSQTFISALENLSRLNDPNKLTAWVFTIARYKAFDFLRKSKRHPTIDYDEELVQKVTFGEELSQIDSERLSELESLISRLKPQEKEYLYLRIVAELRFAEISLILSEPETRIKKKYYRLLERLKAQVEK